LQNYKESLFMILSKKKNRTQDVNYYPVTHTVFGLKQNKNY
jgi:hypothetical protein